MGWLHTTAPPQVRSREQDDKGQGVCLGQGVCVCVCAYRKVVGVAASSALWKENKNRSQFARQILSVCGTHALNTRNVRCLVSGCYRKNTKKCIKEKLSKNIKCLGHGFKISRVRSVAVCVSVRFLAGGEGG